jgi:hypothetical protein
MPVHTQRQMAVSRRQLIAGAGALAAGGVGIAAVGAQPARAAVALAVSDAEHVGKDGSVADVRLSVAGAYQFSAPNAASVALDLAVSPPDADDYQAIDAIERTVSRNSGAGEFELSGSVLAHDSLDGAQFSADAAETVSQAVGVRVGLSVVADGSVVASDAGTAQPTVTVENTQAETTAEVTADGDLTVEV